MESKIFIISGPSGAGEDSVIKGIREKMEIISPTTTTTRNMRDGESEGNPYYFISEEDFRSKVANNEFFEWAEEDRGKLYGVTRKELEKVKTSGKTVIIKVDYKGVMTIKKLIPESKAIYISAPLDVIEKRLRSRNNDGGEEFIKERLEYAKGWEENEHIFDFKVENVDGKLNETIEKVFSILNQ